jgi:peptidyl-prolyl cis-trans isomerase D
MPRSTRRKEQVKTRHILIIGAAGADAKTDAAAKAKARGCAEAGAGGRELCRSGEEVLGGPGQQGPGRRAAADSDGQLDPAYAKAAMALNPGQTSDLVKSAFGYHIIQTEQKQPAGVKPLAEVKDSIVQVLQAAEAGRGGAAALRAAGGRGEEGRAGEDGGGAWALR